jgi:hypothetical protein
LGWGRLEGAADLGRALGHGLQPCAWPPAIAVGRAGGAVVLDLQTEVAVDGDRNSDLVGMGVAGDVGQGLGDDPVGSHLHRCRQHRQGWRCLQGDREPLAAEPVDLFAERPQQAQFVKRRRP